MSKFLERNAQAALRRKNRGVGACAIVFQTADAVEIFRVGILQSNGITLRLNVKFISRLPVQVNRAQIFKFTGAQISNNIIRANVKLAQNIFALVNVKAFAGHRLDNRAEQAVVQVAVAEISVAEMRAVLKKFTVRLKKFFDAEIRRNAVNFAVAQSRSVARQIPHARAGFKAEVFTGVGVKVNPAAFDQLHNRKNREKLAHRGGSESSRAGDGLIFFETAHAEKIRVNFGAVSIDNHASSGNHFNTLLDFIFASWYYIRNFS